MKTKILIFVFLLNSIVSLSQENRLLENILYKPSESEKAIKYYNEAHYYFEEKNFEKAVILYKLAIIEDPDYIDAYDNLGIAYRYLNLLDSAESYYLLSHRKYPKGTVAIINLAVVQNLKGNSEGAIVYYEQSIELEPENPEGYYGLSRMQLILENYGEAFKNGQIAVNYYKQINSPYIVDGYYLLYLICYNNKDIQLAQKYLDLSKAAGIALDKKSRN